MIDAGESSSFFKDNSADQSKNLNRGSGRASVYATTVEDRRNPEEKHTSSEVSGQEYALKEVKHTSFEEFKQSWEYSVYNKLADRDYRDTHILIPLAYQKRPDIHRKLDAVFTGSKARKKRTSFDLVFPVMRGGDLQRQKEHIATLDKNSDKFKELIIAYIDDMLHALTLLHGELQSAHADFYSHQIFIDKGRFYLGDLATVESKEDKSASDDIDSFVIILCTLLLGAETNRIYRDPDNKAAQEKPDRSVSKFMFELFEERIYRNDLKTSQIRKDAFPVAEMNRVFQENIHFFPEEASHLRYSDFLIAYFMSIIKERYDENLSRAIRALYEDRFAFEEPGTDADYTPYAEAITAALRNADYKENPNAST